MITLASPRTTKRVVKFRKVATMDEDRSLYETSLWPLTTRSAFVTKMEGAGKEEITTGSPESLPSLAAISQTSTDGDDHPHLEYEIPGVLVKSVLSEDAMTATSWPSPDTVNFPAILDTDDCSSGILSAEALDLSEASVHSFASMATLKSPSCRLSSVESVTSDPVLDPVEAEDVQINRTCHGALNIDPKQLANIFALFKNEPKTPPSKIEKQPTEPPGSRHIELTAISPEAVRSPTVKIEQPVVSNAHPWTGYARNEKMTAEMYWQPRAETLKKECGTLKAIISADSSKIFQLKTALAAQSAAIESFKNQLGKAKRDLENLQKEKDILTETATEHRETIRILKEEVDRLTRYDMPTPTGGIAVASPSVKLEFEQLRMENHLFASQIIEYEAELERITQDRVLTEKNNVHHVHQPADLQNVERVSTGAVDQIRLTASSDNDNQTATILPPTKRDHKEAAIDHHEDCQRAEVCLQQVSLDLPVSDPQNILGTVVGMLTLGGNGDLDYTESDGVTKTAEITKATAVEVDTVQGRTLDEDPSYVEVQRLEVSQQVEKRDPPATGMEETAIEVLENHDSSLEIEVQLSPYPVSIKEEESEAISHSGLCDENCGAWNIFHIFSTDPQDRSSGNQMVET